MLSRTQQGLSHSVTSGHDEDDLRSPEPHLSEGLTETSAQDQDLFNAVAGQGRHNGPGFRPRLFEARPAREYFGGQVTERDILSELEPQVCLGCEPLPIKPTTLRRQRAQQRAIRFDNGLLHRKPSTIATPCKVGCDC